MRLENRVILICGGTGPVERRLALAFGQEGAMVMFGGTDQEAGSAIQAELESRGVAASFFPCDPGDEAAVQSLVADAVMTYGSLDGLVNSVEAPPAGDAVETDGAAWDHALDGQVRGAWLACRAALPFLKQSRGASIVNVVSTDGLQTEARSLLAATANGALNAMTRSLAIDFGPHDIRVNAIAAGFIETDDTRRALNAAAEGGNEFHRVMSVHPLGRLGRPSDIAFAALFLLGHESSFVTGSTLVVDGGRSIVTQSLYA